MSSRKEKTSITQKLRKIKNSNYAHSGQVSKDTVNKGAPLQRLRTMTKRLIDLKKLEKKNKNCSRLMKA